MRTIFRNSRLIWLLLVVAGATCIFSLWRNATTVDRQTTEIVEPGVSLTTIERTGAQPLRMFVVRTSFAQGWRLRVVASDGSATGRDFGPGAALRRTTVSSMLATHNRIYKESTAPVAVNGGFFAYEGAAVGAVKLSNQWIRLPWKNRTAIGFAKDGKARIDNLKATSRVVFENGLTVPISGLNSFPIKNAFTVLTSHFAAQYKLKPEEAALMIEGGEITSKTTSGVATIYQGANKFLLVAHGSARPKLESINQILSANLEVTTVPAAWQNYPTILGAGPRLVRNGEVHTTEVEEEFRPDVTQRGPRTAVGIDKAGNYFLAVVESGIQNGTGLTLPELAQEMKALGAVDAINLDGGASVALIVKGKVITPQTPEVPVANAILVVREKPAP